MHERHDPAGHRFPDAQRPGGADHTGPDRHGAGHRVHRGRDVGHHPLPQRLAAPTLARRAGDGIPGVDHRGLAGRDVEHDVQGPRVRDLDERLALVHGGPQHGGHAGDDARQRGA